MKHTLKQCMALVLAFLLCLSMMPVAMAVETHSHDMSVDCGNSAPITFKAWDGSSELDFTNNDEISVYLTDQRNGKIQIPAGKTLNLCLHGNTVSAANSSNSTYGAIEIGSGGRLNLCNCEGNGTVTDTAANGIANYGGSVRVYGGTVSGASNSGIYNTASGSVYVYDGSISGGYGIQNVGNVANQVHISGGTVTGTSNAAVMSNSNNVMIYLSGTPSISGNRSDIYIKSSVEMCICAKENGVLYTGNPIDVKYDSVIADMFAVKGLGNTYNNEFRLVNEGYEFDYGYYHDNYGYRLKIKAKTCSVVLNTNGGTINSGNVTSHAYGTATILPTNITKENHSFGGWFDNEGLTGTAVTQIPAKADISTPKIYYAKWTENVYTHDHPVCGAGASCSCGKNHAVLTGWKKLTTDTSGNLCIDGTALNKAYDATYYGDCYTLPEGNYYIDQDSITLAYGLYVPAGETVTLCFNGKTLTTARDKNNNIYGTLNITDCQTTPGKFCGVSGNYNSILTIPTGGTVNMYHVELSGNKMESGNESGGAVYVSGGTFNMYSGSIADNKAGNGGGIFINNGEINMYGGSITNNEAIGSNGGGGVYVSGSGKFTMYGGSINGNNRATNYYGIGGGVYVNGGTFKVSGTAKVTDNMDSNIMLCNDQTMTVENLASGASFGVSTQTAPTSGSPVAITGTNSDDYRSYFFADDSANCEVVNDANNVLKLRVKSAPAPTTYTVTVTDDGNGTASASSATAAAGTEITLTVSPDTGYAFKEWQVTAPSSGLSISNNKFTMPAENVEIKAVFEATGTTPQPTTYTVSVRANDDSYGTVSGGGTYNEGDSVTVTAAPAAGYQFVKWTENGGEVSTSASYTFTATDRSLTAVFEAIGGGTTPGGNDPAAPNNLPMLINPAKAPVVTEPVEDQLAVACVDSTVTMQVETENEGSYQWYVDRGNGFVPIAGANKPSYTTSPVELRNDGYRYYCKVSNRHGSDASPIFTLAVVEYLDVPKTGGTSGSLFAGIALLALAAGCACMGSRKKNGSVR